MGKVSLGGFPDLAGAVTKLSESVKNIEKNFDSALGLEEKSEAKPEGNIIFLHVLVFVNIRNNSFAKDKDAWIFENFDVGGRSS